MKLVHLTWIGTLSFCLVSGCAYIQGRNDQNGAVAQTPKQTKGINVNAGSVPAPAMNRPNPSETASKMIAPITE